MFDAVGTLIAPDPEVSWVYREAGKRHGLNLSEVEIARRFDVALQKSDWWNPTSESLERDRWRTIVAAVFRELNQRTTDIFEELWDHFARPQNWRPFEDALAIWPNFRESPWDLGIASNFDGRLRWIQESYFPLRRSELLFCSSEVGWSKPSPAFFKAIQERLAVAPEAILLVGDGRSNDYQAALDAGWQAIHLDRTSNSPEGNSVRSLTQVERLLRDMG